MWLELHTEDRGTFIGEVTGVERLQELVEYLNRNEFLIIRRAAQVLFKPEQGAAGGPPAAKMSPVGKRGTEGNVVLSKKLLSVFSDMAEDAKDIVSLKSHYSGIIQTITT